MRSNKKSTISELLDHIMQKIVIPVSICYMMCMLGTKISESESENDLQISDPITLFTDA